MRYKVDEQEVGPVWSGHIRVFNAELTFEGGSSDPRNNEEEEPGVFMAVGPARKALALTVSPFYPHELMPDDFNWETSPRHAPPPYMLTLSATGPVSFYWQAEGGAPLTGGGMVLGGLDEIEVEERSLAVEPGDRLLVYTDGVPDYANRQGERFGVERLKAAAAEGHDHRGPEFLQGVVRRIDEFAGGAAPADDLTLVVAEHTHDEPDWLQTYTHP